MVSVLGAVRRGALGMLLLAAALPAFAAKPTHYVLGDVSARTPGKVEPGLLLMGGGDRNFEAMRWFMKKAGNGHIVVLRASQAGEIGEEFFNEVGGIASVETYVFSDRESASDPAVLRSLKRADGIFLAGGDQSRYVRYWRGTPVGAALDAHVRAGKPLGGTSAGLAMQGEYLYGAMDGGSVISPHALADPLGPDNTIETDFLQLALLKGVITDTHFSERNRLGRLIAFVAKAESLAGRPILGLGVDEDAAVAVEGDGTARVYATAPGAGATVVKGGFAQKQVEDEPMNLDRVDTVIAGVDSVLHLPSGRVDNPAAERRYAVRNGVLVAMDAPVLVIHGGAGVERAGMTPADEVAARTALEAALRAGHAQLKAGKPALEAVTAAITVLEDAPQFNAGRGAVFTHDGRNELDSSIMDGATGKAGAVAVRAPRQEPDHPGARGDGPVAPRDDGRRRRRGVRQGAGHRPGRSVLLPHRKALAAAAERVEGRAAGAGEPHAAGPAGQGLLRHGRRAGAGCEGPAGRRDVTGGMTNKRYGRVGDSPIIGAGTWADDRCAFSRHRLGRVLHPCRRRARGLRPRAPGRPQPRARRGQRDQPRHPQGRRRWRCDRAGRRWQHGVPVQYRGHVPRLDRRRWRAACGHLQGRSAARALSRDGAMLRLSSGRDEAMRKMWGIGLLMVALSAASAEPAPKPIHFRAHARVALDAQGVPQQVDVDQKLPAVIRDAIAQRVGQWRFEPARAGEQPRAGATTVFVDACAVPSVDGDMRLAVDYGWNGPGYADGRYFHPAPRYPVEAARRNKGGAFRVVLQIGTDGRATVETIEAQEGQLPLFEQALRTWVASLRYVPEEIDGAPVATRVAIPVDFSMGGPGLREYRRQEREARQQSPECKAAMGAEDASPSQPVVLDSPFRPVTTG